MVRRAWPRITITLAVSTAALPVLAWAASQLIGDPVQRAGMQAVGVAPAEVATVALCVLAGGEASVCAVLLAASTLITVLAAGPVLSLLGPAAAGPACGLLATLALVVALPLAAGVALRAVRSPGPAADAVIRLVTVAALLILLVQVASQIRLDAGYARVTAALACYLAGSAVLGGCCSLSAPPPRARPPCCCRWRCATSRSRPGSRPPLSARRPPPPLGAYGVLVLPARRFRRCGAAEPGAGGA